MSNVLLDKKHLRSSMLLFDELSARVSDTYSSSLKMSSSRSSLPSASSSSSSPSSSSA